jgi:hypothetical protein
MAGCGMTWARAGIASSGGTKAAINPAKPGAAARRGPPSTGAGKAAISVPTESAMAFFLAVSGV